MDVLFPDIEALMKSYFDFKEEIGDNKVWQRKLEEDVGTHIAFLASNMDESSKDVLVEKSKYFAMYEEEKQTFFK